MEAVRIFYGHLVYFMAVLYREWPFGIFSPVLVRCTKKKLATQVLIMSSVSKLGGQLRSRNFVQTLARKGVEALLCVSSSAARPRPGRSLIETFFYILRKRASLDRGLRRYLPT
jgi:hypothetical protein